MMLLMQSPAAVSCPPTQRQLSWTPAKKQIEKEKTHDWRADKVIIIKEVQRFTRIYIFPE